ncbi:MAG TPA: TonB-dependent receptor [Rhizomicrobium sp.]
MLKSKHKNRNFRSGLLLGAASAAALGAGTQASAQQSGGTVETVVVTGSRIPQTGIYSASPVTAIGQQEMKFEGTTDVTNLVNQLPESFVDMNEGVSNGATGTANVDLRGLGAKRTLVLVNGTRLMPGDVAAPVADLNDIPAALVDHVEVLTGGASATYGSDALAGVVNFIMRKDFEGIELDGTYSVTQNDNSNNSFRQLTQQEIDGNAFGFAQSGENTWNGATEDGTLIMGANSPNDKGNVTAYIGYRHIAPVLEATRDYSECTVASTGPNFACSGSSNYNRWLSFDDLVGGHSYDFFQTGTGKSGSGVFAPYDGSAAQHFNYGSINYFQRPDERYTGGFFAHYQENKQLDVYSSFMFSDDHTVSQVAQSGLFLGSGTAGSGAVEVNCSNPLMTAQENFSLCGQNSSATATVNGRTFYTGAGNLVPGQSTDLIGRRDIEGGDRQADLRHTAYRMNVGARGELGDGWTYDAYAQYGETLFQNHFTGEFSKARTQNALEVDPATGQCYAAEGGAGGSATDPGCVPLDIFNGIGSISPQQLKYVLADGFQEGWTQEQVVSGSITGDLGEWGGQLPWAKNPIGVSFGTEYRQEQLKLSTDREFSTNDLYGQGAATLSVPQSGFSVTEGFTEVKIPVIQGVPWIEDLTLNGGYRYSSYSSAGSTNTYKYGVEWQPIDDFRLRGSVQRAVRAPNVLELFAPANVVLFSGQDPCAGATGVVLANCKKEGVTNAGSAVLLCPATQCNQQLSGNAQLKPETSDTRTIGGVFTPTFIDGFTATVDWFDIDVNQFISTLPPQEVLNECYGANSTSASQGYFCPFVHRNAQGLVYGTGFVAANSINTGSLKTKGIDYELNYQTSFDDLSPMSAGWGSLALNDIGTWLDTLTTEPVPVSPLTTALQLPYNCSGKYGITCGTPDPRWRNKFRVTWTTPWDFDVSMAWRYVGAVSLDADSSNPLIGGNSNSVTCPNGKTIHGGPFNPNVGVLGGDCADAQIGSYDYFDLAVNWTVREGVEVRGGVNNIFDIEPPVIGTSALPLPFGNGNTFPGLYDSLGRTIFVGATIKY